MSSRFRVTCTTLLLSAFSAACGGGSDDVATVSQTAGLLRNCPAIAATARAAPGTLGAVVDSLAITEMTTKGIPALTVTVAKKGVILYTRAYGYADLASCRPAELSTAFQIGSVTEQFTAAAVLQLQDAGLLDIDDKVARYLPGYAVDPRLTLRMLLNQTAGLADYTQADSAAGWTRGVAQDVVLTAIVKAPALFAPGSAYAYSNSHYFMLAAIVEAVSKTSYADYLATHIFQPLALRHTSYTAPPAAQAALPYTTTHPLVAGTRGLAAGVTVDPSLYFGAGALWSTSDDLAKWDAALLGGAVIPPALLANALTPPASIPVFQGSAPTSYAMGWISDKFNARPLVWHNGRTHAYTAFNGALLDSGFSLSILANVDLQEEAPLTTLGQNLLQAICTGTGTAANC